MLADDAVPVPRDPPIPPKRLERDALPAFALRDQCANRRGAFGARDDLRRREDPVLAACSQEVLVRAERELDVLAGELA